MRNFRTWLKSKKIPRFTVDRGSYLALMVGLLLGRTTFADSLSPFGPAFYAGTRAVGGFTPVLAGLGALAGSALLGRWDILGYHALSMVLTTLFMRADGKRVCPAALDALVAGGLVAASRSIVNILESPTLYAYVFAVLEGLCASIIALLARAAFVPAGERTPSRQERSSESLLVLLLLSLGGLVGVQILGMNLATLAAMACALLVGYVVGPGPGAIAGLSGGLVIALTGSEDPGIIGMLGAAGMLAGIGGWFGKVESVLGYLSAGLLMSLYINSQEPLVAARRLLEQALASIPLVLVDGKAIRALAERFPMLAHVRRPEKPKFEIEPTKMRVAAISHALNEMGKMLSETSTGDEAQSLPEEVTLASPPAVAPLKQVVERVCRECERQSVCWEEEFGETYQAFSSFVRQIGVSGQISSATDSSGLADRCLHFAEVVAEINHYRELQRLQARVKAINNETKECLSFQYRCLGQLLSLRVITGDEPRRSPRPQMKVVFHGDTLPAEGGTKAGDMWAKYELSPSCVLAVLVDGMGKGDVAAQQSRDTLAILKSLLDCGLDYDSCVSFLNSALFLSGGADRFVALDCLLIDQQTERAYFHKLGSPPSFIRKKDGNVLVVRGQKPPAGAFCSVPSFATSEPVAPGDLIFMVSDGVFRSSPIPARAEHLLVSRLRRLKDETAESAIKSLLGSGQRLRGQELADDVTIVAARVDRV